MPKIKTCVTCGGGNARHGLAWDPVGDRWCHPCSHAHPLSVVLKERHCITCITDHTSKPRCAVFGIVNTKQRKWCTRHKPRDAVNLCARQCECKSAQPTFGKPGTRKPRWCLKCKPDDAVNITASKCACALEKQPTFGKPGDERPTWCTKCKPVDAIDLRHQLCACKKCLPTYGNPGDTKATWCMACKPVDAVNVTARMCECGKAQPCFGLTDDTSPRWCVNCLTKPSDALDIRSRRCECGSRQPTFGSPMSGRPIWCKNCPNKTDDAVNIHENRKCACDRQVRPCYGKPWDEKGTWCAECPNKPEDAIDIVNERCACGRTQPRFAAPGTTRAQWCMFCPTKDEEAINVAKNTCAQPSCIIQVANQPKYRGYCLFHFATMFPDEEIPRNYRIKELTFVSFLRDELLKTGRVRIHQLLFNKQIGSSKGRPDMMLITSTHVVFGEIDEKQHKTDKYRNNEAKRMFELYDDVGRVPSVFLRINPDSYRSAKGRRHPSCFKEDATGKLVVRTEGDLRTRLIYTLKRFFYHLVTIPSREITVEYLYFDGFAE